MKELQDRNIQYKYVQTDQHPELNRILESKFGLKSPNLCLWNSKKDLVKFYEMPIWFLTCFKNAVKNRKFFTNEKIIITHGDTMSTLFACIIGKLFGLKIAHIEAGLRSFSLMHPFPEEMIRRVVSKLASLLFAPSAWAINNLTREPGRAINTKQNTVYDTLANYVTKQDNLQKDKYVVAAIHRQETIYNQARFKKAVDLVESIAKKFKVIYIIHKTSEYQLKQYRFWERLQENPNIKMTGYLEYITFMNLVQNCEFVMSDGGGLQEETYFLNVPCLILRNRTEREIGLNETSYLSGFDDEKINYFISNYSNFHRKQEFIRYYPSKMIVNELVKYEKTL
ncbi:MAG: UDP-N-acetyl glucosamine 2-epimerase [Ignavibacteria bacterium]|nr:UDP-N-acetyl glucosamine 2-epimerase [Ignavibacteria bacterium]